MKRISILFYTLCIYSAAISLCADVIIQMTTIGNPGNTADWTGMGSVDYTYYIGTYEVTVAQYTEFLNAVASSDPYGLYSDSKGATGSDLNIKQ